MSFSSWRVGWKQDDKHRSMIWETQEGMHSLAQLLHIQFSPIYHQISNISHTKYENLNVSHLISSCSWFCPIHWSQVLSWSLRCSWSSADRRCSNYVWVINNFIPCSGASYIRGFRVVTMRHVTLVASAISLSHYNSYEDQAPIDEIYRCPIFKWVAKT